MFRSVLKLLYASLIIGCLTAFASAQGKQKSIHSPAVEAGYVQAESYDRYIIRGKKGQSMIIRIASRRGESGASFMVIDSNDLPESEPTSFGNYAPDGNHWVSRLPHRGDYYIDVRANPASHYKLWVSIR